MRGNRPAGVLLILAALLLVAFAAPVAAAAAYSGSIDATGHAAGGASWASAHVDTPALTRRIEDEVAPELSWAPSLKGAGPGGIGYNTLDQNRPGCTKLCAGKKRNQPYTRPCADIYHCPTH